MSEYQYYEFIAVDRQLTEKEMRELRSYSSRAKITPSSFVNDYSWGDFKGDSNLWMKKYFDAFLYYANWGTRVLKLGLSSRLLDREVASSYCNNRAATMSTAAGRIILSFESDTEEGVSDYDEWSLGPFIPLRTELGRGDLRALYLGWLLGVQLEDLDEDEFEPPVPPGLGELSESLKHLVEFLSIDQDLIDVAARHSSPITASIPKEEDVRAWVATIPVDLKDDYLTSLIVNGRHVIDEIFKKFLTRDSSAPTEPAGRRTAIELLRAAEALAEENRRLEAERKAEEKARREREAAIAREKYLDSLAGQEPELWARIERLIDKKQPKGYEEAIKLLGDLCGLAARGDTREFEAGLKMLRNEHSRKPAFIKRLDDSGF